ncbi:MAG: hypothetical protein QF632_04515 [Candidatus Woesearchaeota archaeon]|jgi:hypothetical protein|nr:hypothetical protein [Candidatus Woesearchaeota archaeon]
MKDLYARTLQLMLHIDPTSSTLKELSEKLESKDEEISRNIDKRRDEYARITRPKTVEEFAEKAMELFDRSDAYQGEIVNSVYGWGSEQLFEMPSGNGKTIIYGFDNNVLSRSFRWLLKIGLGVPHVGCQESDIYRAVIQEKYHDPEKYLFIKFYTTPTTFQDQSIRLVFETNDREYAQKHEKFGFNVESKGSTE